MAFNIIYKLVTKKKYLCLAYRQAPGKFYYYLYLVILICAELNFSSKHGILKNFNFLLPKPVV